MLKVDNIHTYYGNIHALKGVSLEVNAGEIVTLVGSNGAGKTTTVKTIAGLLTAAEGGVFFNGEDITELAADKTVRKGIALVPEGRQIFPFMTVQENLDMGAYSRTGDADIKYSYQEVFTLFPKLWERRKQQAGTLSGGEQQMLAMGRALMAKPKLLLLDEPSLGLAPILVETIFTLIQEINRQGTSVLLIEQNARMALLIAHRGYILETGKIVLADQADKLLNSDEVRKAYLGE
ncbi:ABC transporter ATP-binding protein [Sporomusa aerivorans]|uniref:ABC transporter ATP-binding protein n=1 Tax=Sporomusa aerivorans TaxID=204936 RepID=UPI00352BC83C